MEFKQFYLPCLAHASYLIGNDGECAIVDPQRDVDQYLEEARARGLEIKYVIETHLHADFVSGHLELAQRTGATIYIGHRAGADYDAVAVHDGDEIRMGSVVLRFLETPGHTPESVCVLATDESAGGAAQKVLTGDTLFIGDVGRPDLVGSKGYTAEEMAGFMYDSLHGKLLTLPDTVEVYPAHGAGSACGRNISSALSSTIGEQRQTNHALADMSRDAFVAMATAGLSAPPAYFSHDAELNRRGPPALDELPRPQPLTPDEFAARVDAGAIPLDVRRNVAFGAGHVPGAVNIGLGGNFASWCGSLLPVDEPLVLVTADEPGVHEAGVHEAVLRLARVGLHRVVGFLQGGMDAWTAAGRAQAELPQIAVEDLAARRERGELAVLDVRTVTEHDGAHVPGAANIPLPELERRVTEVVRDGPLAVICKSGYRSSAACSLLRRHGIEVLFNVAGGTDAFVAAGLPVEAGVASGDCGG